MSMFIIYTAHRALEDVKAMRRVFSTNAMSPFLLQLTIRNNGQVIAHWQDERNEWTAAQQFVVQFGRQFTNTIIMAIRLKESNICYGELKSIFHEYPTSKAFDDHLRTRGVKRKTWRQKYGATFLSCTIVNVRLSAYL